MVDSLQFNVAQLLRDPIGASRHADLAFALSELAPDLTAGDAAVAADGLLQGRVRLMRTNAGVLAQGQFVGEITQACGRCLQPVPVRLKVELEEVYTPTLDIVTGRSITPEEEDQALWIDEHHILDLTEVLRQDALVALPLSVTCADDCRGLCATCGRNLNEGPCACTPEIDGRWSALAALLNTKQ